MKEEDAPRPWRHTFDMDTDMDEVVDRHRAPLALGLTAAKCKRIVLLANREMEMAELVGRLAAQLRQLANVESVRGNLDHRDEDVLDALLREAKAALRKRS